MKKILAAIAFVLLSAGAALAQSSPNLITGQVPTAAQWNNYFKQKQDVLNFSPLNVAGGFMTGKLTTTASTIASSGFNVSPGVAPSSPANGDVWTTATGVFARINGVTVGPLSGPSSASFTATAPVAVTFPGGGTNYALNFNATLTGAGGNLGINLANPNAWTGQQTFVAPVLGTPASANLSNATSLPIATGVSGLGTGVAAALAVNTGTAGSLVVRGSTLGTPSGGDLSNLTNLPISTGVSGLGANVAAYLATPTSANLLAATPDETGSGSLVFGTAPSISSPALSGTVTGTYTLGGTPSISGGSVNSGIVAGTYGGTGINNGARTISVGGNFSASSTVNITGALSTAGAFTQAGAFATTLTSTATTNASLPAGTHTLTAPDVAQTWSALQGFNDGVLALNGLTSGSLTLRAAAASGISVLRFPNGSTDFSATGGASQVVAQSTLGAPLTVRQLAFSDLSGSGTCAQEPALTGDVTTPAGSCATTLATVNSNVGGFGSSTAIPNFTVNAKGLVTAAGTSAVVAPAGTLTGSALASNVLTSSLTGVGTLTSGSIGSGFTTVALLYGGSGNTTAAGARGPSGFNIDQMTTVGDANLTISATTRTVATTATLTAARTFSLPAASSLNPGQSLVILDQAGAINGPNVITVARSGSDTINGASTSPISTQYGGMIATSDGVSKWTTLSSGSGGGGGGSGTVTSVATGQCLIGGPITTTGSIDVNAATCLRGYKSGLTLSTAGASTTFGTASGSATDGGNASFMVLSTALTKTTAAWAVGTAAGSLDTGTIAANTWYHVFLMRRPDTGVVDECISTTVGGCVTGAAIPAAYTQFRRIGSMLTNASSQWTKFVQDGNRFVWDAPFTDAAGTNPGIAAVTRALTVPDGVRVQAQFAIATGGQPGPGAIYVSDLNVSDVTPQLPALPGNGGVYAVTVSNIGGYSRFDTMTNTTRQVRTRVQLSDANLSFYLYTFGWTDDFGGSGASGGGGGGGGAVSSVNSVTGAVVVQTPPAGRVTLQTGVAAPTTGSTNVTTIYYTPFGGSQVPLNNGSGVFVPTTFSELSLPLDSNSADSGYHASGSVFDLWVYNDAGTIRFGSGPAWTSTTARSLGRTVVNGYFTNGSSFTMRYGTGSATVAVATNMATYVGSFMATANGAATDTPALRLVFNGYNQLQRGIEVTDPGNTWTYTGQAFRQANASTANQVQILNGGGYMWSDVTAVTVGQCTASGLTILTGVGINNINNVAFSQYSNTPGTLPITTSARYQGTLNLGLSNVIWLESGCWNGVTATATTFFGTGSGAQLFKTGLSGSVSL